MKTLVVALLLVGGAVGVAGCLSSIIPAHQSSGGADAGINAGGGGSSAGGGGSDIVEDGGSVGDGG